MAYLAFLSGVIYIVSFFSVFVSVFRASKFWIVFVSIEYFYLIGLGVFPVALSFGYADFPEELKSYASLETIGEVSFFHLMFYALGAFVGWFSFFGLKNNISTKLERFSVGLSIDPYRALFLFLFVAYFASVAYVSLLGPERVFLGASMARGGDRDEFSGFESYLFLTRFLYFGVYAVAFLPFVLTRARYPIFYMAAFFILGVAGYFILSARYMLFQCALLPFLFYLSYSGRFGLSAILISCAMVGLALLGVFYGKELPTVVGNYLFNNGSFEFFYSDEKDFFRSFSQFFYSIDAGINSFYEGGPYVSRDVFLGPLGFLPSSFFSVLGLDGVSYILLDYADRFACVNTKIITGSYSSCFMPPYFIGASAYVLPIAGGFLFGFFRFFVYSVASICWSRMAGREQHLALVILLVISLEQLMLFIPNASAFVVFLWIFIFLARAVGFLRSR